MGAEWCSLQALWGGWGRQPIAGPLGPGAETGERGGRRESQPFKSPAETGGNVQFHPADSTAF